MTESKTIFFLFKLVWKILGFGYENVLIHWKTWIFLEDFWIDFGTITWWKFTIFNPWWVLLNGSQVLMLEGCFLLQQLKSFPSSLSKISNHFGAAALSHLIAWCVPQTLGTLTSWLWDWVYNYKIHFAYIKDCVWICCFQILHRAMFNPNESLDRDR